MGSTSLSLLGGLSVPRSEPQDGNILTITAKNVRYNKIYITYIINNVMSRLPFQAIKTLHIGVKHVNYQASRIKKFTFTKYISVINRD